jgi:hypothetical protein
MPLLRHAVTGTLFCLVAVGVAGCHRKPATTAVAPDEARQLLLDRNWVDRLPETAQDRLQVFRFVPSMGGGVFQDRTLYAGQFELFNFDHDGESIQFHLRHTGEERTTHYTIERLPAGDDSPYDLHLTLSDSPRGAHDYYSIRGMHGAAQEKALEEGLRNLWQKSAKH